MSPNITDKGPPIAKPAKPFVYKHFDLLDDTIFCQFVRQSLEYVFFAVFVHNFSLYYRFYE